jgi:hypothetical protein
MSDALKIHLDTEDSAICTFGPVICAVWRRAQSTEAVGVADAAIEELVERYGEGRRLFYLHRTPDRPGFHRSSAELQKAMIAHFERQEERFLAAALALEAKGLGGAMHRAVTAAVMRIRKSKVRSQPFVDARDGVRWLGELSRDVSPFDANALIRALSDANLCLKT